mmetsp:Transcript_11607/g.11629  ORF Transcript_11607/g.11629 Transcript_11607/m.11629 type:complete len:116 (+) Transcript_11607:109-456(+)
MPSSPTINDKAAQLQSASSDKDDKFLKRRRDDEESDSSEEEEESNPQAEVTIEEIMQMTKQELTSDQVKKITSDLTRLSSWRSTQKSLPSPKTKKSKISSIVLIVMTITQIFFAI